MSSLIAPRLTRLIGWITALIVALAVGPWPALASLSDDRYDGNIYALYAGNGSLVPPRATLEQAMAGHRVAALIYYLDDSAVSKRFAPVVSELQRLWGNRIDLIPLVTDPLQNHPATGATDPASYWSGVIPQVVILDGDGRVVFDERGQVSVDAINRALSQATGVPIAPAGGRSTTESFNELNTEVRAAS